MRERDAKRIIDACVQAYSCFDIDGMMALIHPDIEFTNISGGMVNAAAAGAEETIRLQGRSEFTFRHRKIYRITDIS